MRRVAPAGALVLGLLLLALGLAMPGLPSATGAPSGVAVPGVELSRDGTTWTPVLDASDGFGGAPTWRPGETRTARLFVRRTGDGTRDLALQLSHQAVVDVADALIGDGYLRVAARVGDGAWAPVDLALAQQGIHVDGVAPGALVPIELRATLSQDAPRPVRIEAQALAFGLEVLSVLAPEPEAAPSAGPLLGLAPVFVGVAMVAVAALVMGQRRRLPA